MIVQSISQYVSGLNDLLRGRSAPDASALSPWRPVRVRDLLLTTLLFGILYGGTMGAFGGIDGLRWLQMLYSALKVPMLLLVSFCLSLPSFFVLNTLLGVREDFSQALRALISTQAGLTIILASLAPFTAFWYASDGDYDAALTFNAAMFGIATFAAQFILRRAYRLLIARDRRHRLLLRTWLAMYAFVAIQMAWVLRPFVGDPHSPVAFFRKDAWGNAYVEIWGIVIRSFKI